MYADASYASYQTPSSCPCTTVEPPRSVATAQAHLRKCISVQRLPPSVPDFRVAALLRPMSGCTTADLVWRLRALAVLEAGNRTCILRRWPLACAADSSSSGYDGASGNAIRTETDSGPPYIQITPSSFR